MNIKKIPKNIIGNYNLNNEDASYLISIGLETGNFGCIDIYEGFETVNNFIVLGYDNDVPICCSNNTGIIAIEPGHTRLVNSSVEQFVTSINIFSRYCKEVVTADSEVSQLNIVNIAIAELRDTDEQAWSSNYNYWPIIGDQMIEGNL